jgi:hypothetical protein
LKLKWGFNRGYFCHCTEPFYQVLKFLPPWKWKIIFYCSTSFQLVWLDTKLKTFHLLFECYYILLLFIITSLLHYIDEKLHNLITVSPLKQKVSYFLLFFLLFFPSSTNLVCHSSPAHFFSSFCCIVYFSLFSFAWRNKIPTFFHFPFFHFLFSYLFMYKSKMPTFFTLFS